MLVSRPPAACLLYSVPQGSVLGPLELTAYTENIIELLDGHEAQSHLHADNTQLYASCALEDIDTVRTYVKLYN